MLYSKQIVKGGKGTVVLIYGMGASANRFKDLVKNLKKNKISCYILEVQGYGKTKGLRGHVDKFEQYTNDLDKLFKIVKKENKHKPLFLFGESLGGLIALKYCILHPNNFERLIAITPALFNIMPLPALRMFINGFVNPKKIYDMPFTPQMITRDKKMQKQIDEDPLENTLASARLNVQILFNMIGVGMKAKKITIPTLILTAGKDKLVSTRVAERFYKKLRCKKKYKNYKNMLHALTVEKDKEIVFKDIITWMI